MGKRRASFGQIDRLPSGNWRARYEHNGTLYKAPTTYKTKGLAEIWVNEQRKSIELGTWTDPNTLTPEQQIENERAVARAQTLSDYARTWIATRTNSKGEPLRVRTRTEYERMLRPAGHRGASDEGGPLALLVGRPIGAITAPQVRQWRAEQLRQGTETQTARAYALLNSIMITAMSDHVISENPCQIKGGAKTSTGIEVLPPTDNELVTILGAIAPHYRALVALGAVGLRYGECVALLSDDVVVERNDDGTVTNVLVHVTKQIVFPPKSAGGSQKGEVKALASKRQVRVFGDDAAIIADHVKGKSAMTPLYPAVTDPSAWLHPTTFHRHWAKARSVAGRDDLHFHALRHYAGTRYAQSGATVKETMARLGHSTTAAAMRYQHAGNRDEELAARAARHA